MFGGGAHYNGRPAKNIPDELRPAIEKTYPKLKGIKIDYAWSGQMAITVNRIPQVGRVTPNCYYIQGYSGHGIALSHILAELTAQAIIGKPSYFDDLASCKAIKFPFSSKLTQYLVQFGVISMSLKEKIQDARFRLF